MYIVFSSHRLHLSSRVCRAKYTSPGSSIYYYSVEWDASELSWEDFRAKVLGATDPEQAASGSMRKEILQRWEALGLPSKPNVGDNGVHGSASPLEGLAERLNWLDETLEVDPTGHALLEAGVKLDTLKAWTKDAQVDVDGTMTSVFDAFEDLSIGPALKLAQKLGGDPFEEPPNFSKNQAFIFIKPHANTVSARAMVKGQLREHSISVVDEGEIDAKTILSKKLIDTHYYAIANKASLSKPFELNVPAGKQAEFAAKFGVEWSTALKSGMAYNAVDACDVLGVDADSLDAFWAAAKKEGRLLKFGGGFYVAKISKAASTAVVPSGSDALADMPRSLLGGLDALALPNGLDESEKMLLFPESVIKAAVDALKEVAIDDFKGEQYERAVKHLTVALSLDEKSHNLYSNRCTAYIALEQYEKAMEDADECVRLQPAWAKGYLRRGSVYFRMGQLEKAEVVLKEGLELDPGNDALKKELEAVMNSIAERMARQRESLECKERAIEAFNEQNFKGAVDLLKKAIKLDPENHIFYSNRAAAYMALEQYDKALGDADECVRLQPTWAKGFSRRGAALFRMDRLGPARDAFEKGLELDSENPTYVRCTKQELQLVMDAIAARKEESLEFKERAIEAFNVQNFKRAEQHLTSAIELDPENHVFYSNRAAAYMAMEKFDKALKDANECVKLQPAWAKGYSRQAAAFLSMSDLPAAREACMKGLDLEPDNQQVKEELRRVEIAESLSLKDSATEAFKAQDYEKAVEDLTAAIRLDPSNQVFFSNRSVAFTAMQMYEKALEDADECIRLQPTWAKGYSRRAAAKFHLGDLQAAKTSYSKAWDLEPTNAKTKADLEHVLSEIAGMKVILPDRG
jgi:tetratricopeptide (TPR) repeat protein